MASPRLGRSGFPWKTLEMAATGLPVVASQMHPIVGLAAAIAVAEDDEQEPRRKGIHGEHPRTAGDAGAEAQARHRAAAEHALGHREAALAAFDPDAVVAVLPSDHVVEKRARFREVLITATAAAEAGHLVTLGITPERPDTGFGYIEAGDRLDVAAPLEVVHVRRFIEKPKRDAAESMLAAGGHFWNAGMFVWRVSEVLRAYREHLPNTAHAVDALTEATGGPRYESVLAEVWEETDRTTIDYGIMERAERVAMVPADIGWHDVGSWARLAEIVAGGANWSAGDHVAVDAEGNYVWAPGKLTALIGVEDLVVVDTPDALLVVSKDRAEDVKAVVDRLRREEREDLL